MNQEEIARALGLPDRSTISRWTAKLLPLHVKGADYTPDEVQVITNYAREHKSRLHVNVQVTPIARAEIPAIARENVIEMPIARDEYIDMHVQDGVQNRILERLEAIESKIDALMALMDKPIAARYGDLQRRPEYTPSSLPVVTPDVPSDWVMLKHFALKHNANPTTVYSQSEVNNPHKFTVTKRAIGARDGRQENWLTPLQQFEVIRYWRSAGFKHTPCEDCPHEPQDEIAQQALIEAETDQWAQRLPLPSKEVQE